MTGGGADGGPAAVQLADGGSLAARAVVVAAEGPEAARLLGPALDAAPSKAAPGVGTCCLYFKAARPPRCVWVRVGACGYCVCMCICVLVRVRVRIPGCVLPAAGLLAGHRPHRPAVPVSMLRLAASSP